MWVLLFLSGILALFVYWILNLSYKYWEKRGVPSPPVSLLFGNLGSSVSLSRSVFQVYNDIYNDFPNLLYVGVYKMRTPGIILRDPNLIKDVLMKEFNSFHDNDFFVDEKVDPVAARNPFTLKGYQWKIVRNQLTPAFTAKKIKTMYFYMEDSAKKMVKFVEKEHDATTANGIDAKELCARYAVEVIATCAFGLDGKSFDETDPEFRRMGRKIFQTSTIAAFKMFLMFIIPSLSTILKLKFFPEDVVLYFQQIIKETLKYRNEHKVVRDDFLDFMLEIKAKPGEYVFDDVDVLAHALGFFVDGFETSSALMCHVLFQLAANRDVQDTLFSDIQDLLQTKNQKLDYDSINEMQYLNAVMCETLRMHPPGLALLRTCTKPFTFPPPRGAGTGKEVPIEVGTPIIIPVYGLHYDPKYYDNPEKFDPSRFLEDDKDHSVKCAFLPFGDGPRSCLGQRFGMLQSKVAVVNIIANFEVTVSSKTKTPLEIDPTSFIPHPKGGIWLNFYKRSN